MSSKPAQIVMTSSNQLYTLFFTICGCIIYLVSNLLHKVVSLDTSFSILVSLPNVLLLVALLLGNRSSWHKILVCVIVLDIFAAFLVDNLSVYHLYLSLLHNLEALVIAATIFKFSEPPFRLVRVREVLLLFITSILASALVALLDYLPLGFSNQTPIWQLWLNWSIVNSLAYLFVAPCIIVWATFSQAYRWPKYAVLLEGFLVCVALIVIVRLAALFSSHYLLGAPMVVAWVAIRFGQRAVAALIAFSSLLCMGSSLQDEGQLYAQLFLAFTLLPLFVLSVATAQKQTEAQTSSADAQPVSLPHALPAEQTSSAPEQLALQSKIAQPLPNEVLAEASQLQANNPADLQRMQTQFIHAQKMESIGLFTGSIAHDFNNILTAISGYTNLARASLPTDDPVYEDLGEVLKVSNHASSLIKQLLTFARRQPSDPFVLNLNDLLMNLDKLLRRIVPEDIEFQFRLAHELKSVKVDPSSIEQVVINLVINARDAMPHGGVLRITTANLSYHELPDRVQSVVKDGDYMLLEVLDTGVGMPPEVLVHAFEPFFTTKAPGKGTGLGLSICRDIIQQQGGSVLLHSEIGQGSSIKIFLPCALDEADFTHEEFDEDDIPRGTETILVVEDEEVVRMLMVRTLRSSGYTVLEASNGNEALNRLHSQHLPRVDLLVTDLVMPKMGGIMVAEYINQLYPSIKVLFTSGYDSPTMPELVNPAYQFDFIAKPFTPLSLGQAIRGLLNHKTVHSSTD
jgi:signal transduction histidine kinase